MQERRKHLLLGPRANNQGWAQGCLGTAPWPPLSPTPAQPGQAPTTSVKLLRPSPRHKAKVLPSPPALPKQSSGRPSIPGHRKVPLFLASDLDFQPRRTEGPWQQQQQPSCHIYKRPEKLYPGASLTGDQLGAMYKSEGWIRHSWHGGNSHTPARGWGPAEAPVGDAHTLHSHVFHEAPAACVH